MSLAYKTKTDMVLEKLRLDIIGGQLKPGQRIVISDVARDSGLSEIPVREAIRRLESEGLVQFTPHVGAVVSTIDESEFLEIYLIRIELEALATRLAVDYIGKKELVVLNSLMQKADIAIKNNRHEELGPLNKEFHMAIYRAGPYPYLLRMITDLWQKFELSSSVFSYVPDRAAASWYEHQQILEAIENKDAELAAELVRKQKNQTMNALEKYLSKSHSAFTEEEA